MIDGIDNCRTDKNEDQADTDMDNIGDACDNCVRIANYDQVEQRRRQSWRCLQDAAALPER